MGFVGLGPNWREGLDGSSSDDPAASDTPETPAPTADTDTPQGPTTDAETLRGLQEHYVTDFMQAAEGGLTDEEIQALATANPDILTIPEGGITDAFREAVAETSILMGRDLGMIPPEAPPETAEETLSRAMPEEQAGIIAGVYNMLSGSGFAEPVVNLVFQSYDPENTPNFEVYESPRDNEGNPVGPGMTEYMSWLNTNEETPMRIPSDMVSGFAQMATVLLRTDINNFRESNGEDQGFVMQAVLSIMSQNDQELDAETLATLVQSMSDDDLMGIIEPMAGGILASGIQSILGFIQNIPFLEPLMGQLQGFFENARYDAPDTSGNTLEPQEPAV